MEKKTKAPPRTRYMSCRADEFERLRELGFQERWLYLELKWLANFKTGVGGRFGKQRITYESLAALMSRAAVQGLSTQTFDRGTVRRLFQRLEGAELVSEVGKREDNGGLTFRLPCSPIKPQEKLPRDEPLKTDASAGSASDFGELDDAQSVLINPESIKPPFSNRGRRSNLQQARPDEDETPATPSSAERQSPVALTVSYVMKRLEAEHFDYVGSSQSRTLYARWIAQGVSREQFERALLGVRDDFTVRQSPDSIDGRLRGWRRRVIERRARGHGRVAL